MRSLITLVAIGIVVAGIIWGLQRVKQRTPRIRDQAPPAQLDDNLLVERATLAYGPDRGPGVLRLTGSQIIFAADSGRVLAIDRLDIVGVGDTRELPDRTVPRPVLSITTRSDTYFFAVRFPLDWENLLTR